MVCSPPDLTATAGKLILDRSQVPIKLDPLTSKFHLEGLVIENEIIQGEYEFNLRLYTPIEMKQLFSSTGFEDIHLYESINGEEVTRESEGQVILGRK